MKKIEIVINRDVVNMNLTDEVEISDVLKAMDALNAHVKKDQFMKEYIEASVLLSPHLAELLQNEGEALDTLLDFGDEFFEANAGAKYSGLEVAEALGVYIKNKNKNKSKLTAQDVMNTVLAVNIEEFLELLENIIEQKELKNFQNEDEDIIS